MQILAIAVAQTSHIHAGGIDLLTIAYLPAALLGTWSGIAIFRYLSDVHFLSMSMCY